MPDMIAEPTAIPREFSSPSKVKWRRRIVLGAVLFLAVSGPIGCITALSNSGGDTPVEDPAEDIRHQAFATLVAESWLSGVDVDVPVALGLSATLGRDSFTPAEQATVLGLSNDQINPDPTPKPISYTSLEWRDAQLTAVGNVFIEIHRFWVVAATTSTVTDQRGDEQAVKGHRLMELQVPVTETENSLPALAEYPTLLPVGFDSAARELPSLDPALFAPDSQVVPTVADNVVARIEEWATAYAASDERVLYELTGDTADVSYQGLGGFEILDVDVTSGFVREDDRLVTHVIVRMHSPEMAGVVVESGYDLLVGNPTVRLPLILAWGASGTGHLLEPYTNSTGPASESTTTTETTTSTSTTSTTTTTTTAPETAPPDQEGGD